MSTQDALITPHYQVSKLIFVAEAVHFFLTRHIRWRSIAQAELGTMPESLILKLLGGKISMSASQAGTENLRVTNTYPWLGSATASSYRYLSSRASISLVWFLFYITNLNLFTFNSFSLFCVYSLFLPMTLSRTPSKDIIRNVLSR